MKIKFKNGLVKEYAEKVSVIDVINDINPSLGKEACACLLYTSKILGFFSIFFSFM